MSLAICFVLVLNPVCQSVSFSISTADYCIVFSRSSFLFFSLYATSRGTLGGHPAYEGWCTRHASETSLVQLGSLMSFI